MILTTIAIVAQVSPSPAPSASVDPKAASAAADAKQWFAQLRQGQVVASDTLTDQMKSALTPAALDQTKALLKDAGDPTSFDLAQHANVQNLDVYVFHVTFAKAPPLNFIYALDPAGRIAGLLFRAAK